MAELVQLRLENSVGEFEQMERIGLFARDEIRIIIKRVEAFEYKLQRRTKSKDDFLKYIEYEVILLKLIQKRRNERGIMMKKHEIDYSIAKRINKLYRLASIRFQSDIKLWLAHIDFCKSMNWPDSISRMYSRLLKLHVDKPELWILAANWEFQDNKATDAARGIFHAGLRFQPKSELLHQEYFRMELKYCQRIRQRRLIMGLNDMENEAEVSDAIIEGKLPKAVYKHANEAIADINFRLSFLPICREFDFTQTLQDHIYDDLKKNHSDKEEAWDSLAKKYFLNEDKILEQSSSPENIIETMEEQAFQVYKSAVEAVPTEKMGRLYVDACIEQLSKKGSDRTHNNRLGRTLDAMDRCHKNGLLVEDLYMKWALILDTFSHHEKLWQVLEAGKKKYPKSPMLWMEGLRFLISKNSPAKQIFNAFNLAWESVSDEDSPRLWSLAFDWLIITDPARLDKLFQKLLIMPRPIAKQMKVLYLEYTALHKGVDAAREVFFRICNEPPITVALFFKMLDLETCQLNPSIEHQKKILELAVHHYGQTNIDLWIRYIKFDSQLLTSQKGNIYHRATRTLQPEFVEEFVVKFTLRNVEIK